MDISFDFKYCYPVFTVKVKDSMVLWWNYWKYDKNIQKLLFSVQQTYCYMKLKIRFNFDIFCAPLYIIFNYSIRFDIGTNSSNVRHSLTLDPVETQGKFYTFYPDIDATLNYPQFLKIKKKYSEKVSKIFFFYEFFYFYFYSSRMHSII